MSPPHERAHRPSGPHGRHPAPSLADFEAMAARAFARLPATFRALCEDLVIRVDEFPSPEVLAHMGLSQPLRPARPVPGHRPAVPARDRRLRADAQHDLALPAADPGLLAPRQLHGGDSLEAIVTHVLVHEIGHHFGFSDDDMEAIEAQAD